VGLAGSANIGEEFAMFEAIHGSAPRRAGQNVANPSGLLQGAVMMLNHLGQHDVAEKVHNAWLKTLEDGIHTYDIYKEGISKQKVGTSEFADAIIERLGQQPVNLKAANYSNAKPIKLTPYKKRAPAVKELQGVDLFVHWAGTDANELGENLKQIGTENLKINMITNRGIKVWPEGFKETFCTDHWRSRFYSSEGRQATKQELIALQQQALDKGIDVVKTEQLYKFDGKPAYSLGQGQ